MSGSIAVAPLLFLLLFPHLGFSVGIVGLVAIECVFGQIHSHSLTPLALFRSLIVRFGHHLFLDDLIAKFIHLHFIRYTISDTEHLDFITESLEVSTDSAAHLLLHIL